MLEHICKKCGYRNTIFDDYIRHLFDLQHQMISRSSFLKWNDDDNLRSLVIYCPTKPFPLPSEVIDLFFGTGVTVVDFVCWMDRPQNFVVQFSLQDEVEKVMTMMRQNPDQLTFKSNTLGLRRKCDVADFEWPGLIGDGCTRNGSSAGAVLIDLDDSAGDEEDEPVGNGSHSTNNGGTNGDTENMDTDDSAVPNGSSFSLESMEVEEMDEDVLIATKMSASFRTSFLSKVADGKKDDKSKIKENLSNLQSLWLEVYTTFHNRLWPVCFAMKNKISKTSSEDIGFETKFTCECLQSKYNQWFVESRTIKEEVDRNVRGLLLNSLLANKRITELETSITSPDKTILKFRCHVVVTFSDSGDAIAKMTLKKVSGILPNKKIKVVKKAFKEYFEEFEAAHIDEWTPSKKKVKKEKAVASYWTEIGPEATGGQNGN